jgi:membrane protease YdiL (CAAX protease family)
MLRQFKFTETPTDNPQKSLEDGAIQFYIATLSGEEADALPSPAEPAASAANAPRRLKGVPVVKVVYRGNRDTSENGRDRMMALLRRARQADSDLLLSERGFSGDARSLFAIETSNIASTGQVTGSMVGRFITVFLVMLMFTGGAVGAIDIIAGEKERGTLETLLTTAAGRSEIVAAKQLAITSVGLVITLIQALNFFIYIKLQVIELPPNFDLELSTGMALTLVALFLPLAAVIGSVLLMISAYARSYKEAQLFFFPVYMVSLIPSIASVLPGISLRSVIALVPIANVSVAAREILTGRADPPMIVVTFAVMSLTAVWLMRTSARMLTQENIILPAHVEAAEFVGGRPLFEKRILRWFALMWAVEFAVAANIPQLATLRRQLLFNELVIMLGAPLLMIWMYRLKPLEAFNIRPVKPAVWLGILFAIPAGHITALAIFQVVNIFIPAPEQLIRSFSETLIPKDMPWWQLYIYLAVLPGICEELAFRGVLLNGLRRRMKPVALVLTVGLIFGMFHVALFRIAPTALLGMILTVVALLTGSVLPGILMHIGNNALGVWMASNGFNLEGLALEHYAAAIAVFALALWIIYRNRTPLPTR